MQEILSNEKATLWYHPETKIVHHQLRTFIYGKDFREILEKGLALFRKNHARKWLSDNRGHTALDPADTEWATKVWAPQVIAAGWKFWAIVMPVKVLGQMNMKHFINIYGEKGVTVQTFSEPESALLWLEQAGERQGIENREWRMGPDQK